MGREREKVRHLLNVYDRPMRVRKWVRPASLFRPCKLDVSRLDKAIISNVIELGKFCSLEAVHLLKRASIKTGETYP